MQWLPAGIICLVAWIALLVAVGADDGDLAPLAVRGLEAARTKYNWEYDKGTILDFIARFR